MAPRKKADPNNKTVAENRKARYNYAVEDTLECGIMLEGSEVKSMRAGGVNIAESYAAVEDGELWLVNSHIPKYDQAKTFQHEERRRRKLLVSKKELSKLWAEVGRQGMTLVPLKIYFNDKGRAKLLLGIAKGKQKQDKRATEKKQDWKRQQSRLLRDRG
jgi:SsrA-binding protein